MKYPKWGFIDPEKTIAQLERGEWTKWMFTDSSVMACPKCGAPKYHECVSPSGRKKWPPHSERLRALHDTGYTANQIKAYTLAEILTTKKGDAA